MAKEWILKRPVQFSMRFTQREHEIFSQLAEATGLSRVEFARRRIFGIATEAPSGKKRKSTSNADSTKATA